MKLRTVSTPLLDVGYLEAGAPDGPVAVPLHGFPYDALACVDEQAVLGSDLVALVEA